METLHSVLTAFANAKSVNELPFWQQEARRLLKELILIKSNEEKLKEALDIISWFIENDETNEGDEPMEAHGGQSWNDLNGYWIDGLNKARKFVKENA